MEEGTKKFLLKLARKAVEEYVRKEKKISVPTKFPMELRIKRGVFVTLNKKIMNREELRGCIGIPYPTKPLVEGVIEAAISATRDPRFEPLRADELRSVRLEISVLTQPKRMRGKNQKELLDNICPYKHGIIIKRGLKAALFLPQVWYSLPSKEEFLSSLCLKAGLPPNAWLQEGTELYRFEAEIIRE